MTTKPPITALPTKNIDNHSKEKRLLQRKYEITLNGSKKKSQNISNFLKELKEVLDLQLRNIYHNVNDCICCEQTKSHVYEIDNLAQKYGLGEGK